LALDLKGRMAKEYSIKQILDSLRLGDNELHRALC
jgi:hypothetical protein